MFVEKSAEERSKMTPEDLGAYFSAKLKHENEVLEARVKALETEKNSEKFSELDKEVKALKDGQLESLKSALVEQGKVIEGLKAGKFNGSDMHNAELSVDQIIKSHGDDFKKAKEGKHDFKFDVSIEPRATKVVGDMTFAANLSGGTMPSTQRLDGINDIAETVSVIYGLMPKLNVAGNTVDWVYETGQEGAANSTAEGATKNQIDNNFVVTSVSLKKLTAYFKVSTEMLTDVSFMASWLRNKLIVRLFIEVNDQILNGAGAGNDLTGVISLATTWAAGSFALAIDNANNVDSLVVAINQIKIANQSTGRLAILMHPTDVAGLKMVKITSSDKRYLDRLLQVGSTLMLDGYPIVESTQITAGTFLVGDWSKALVIQKGSIEVSVGLDGNDFTKNMRTILAEWRGQVIIQNNDRTAFVKGTFATTNAALETA